jgi:DNA-binding transcriptional LysR family regulator
MNMRHLQQFLAVAETRSFRKAAERLHMAQPPLSIAIRRLEESLGGALFARHPQGVQLTAMGAAVLPEARRAVFHAEALKVAAANARTGIGGTLRIGFIGSATYTLFPKALPIFRQRYPLVNLEMRERTTTQILRDVESGELDLGLVRYPVLEPTTTRLEPVEFDELVVVMPASHPLARRRKLGLAHLKDEPFIMYSSVAALNLRGLVMAACQTAGFTPTVVQEAVQIQTVVSLVESGLGLALVPSVCRRHASTGVVFQRLGPANQRVPVAIAVSTRADAEPETAARLKSLLFELRDKERLVPAGHVGV